MLICEHHPVVHMVSKIGTATPASIDRIAALHEQQLNKEKAKNFVSLVLLSKSCSRPVNQVYVP